MSEMTKRQLIIACTYIHVFMFITGTYNKIAEQFPNYKYIMDESYMQHWKI